MASTVHIFNPFCFCSRGYVIESFLIFPLLLVFIMIIIMIIAEEKSVGSKEPLC